jgi:hypothetical protein
MSSGRIADLVTARMPAAALRVQPGRLPVGSADA